MILARSADLDAVIVEDPFLREGLAGYTITEIGPTRSVIAQIITWPGLPIPRMIRLGP